MAFRTTAQSSGGSAGGGAFGTDLHVMDTAAQYVQHVGDAMTGEVNRLISTLEAELNVSTWEGLAASEFAVAREKWWAAHRQLVGVLNEIEGGLRQSRQKYDQADQDSRDGIARAASNL
jgi:WXG100 family type VII secretion target